MNSPQSILMRTCTYSVIEKACHSCARLSLQLITISTQEKPNYSHIK